MTAEIAIQLSSLEFCYSNEDSWALRCEELSVGVGQQILLQGPSGSGKSTLLNLIAGVLPPVQGEVSVLGTRLNSLNENQRDSWRADHLGFVFQSFNLIPYLSVEDNILLPLYFSSRKERNVRNRGEPRQELQRLLDRLNLGEERFLKRLPYELSVGQQQRVALARALMGEPPLILADEPTSSLDPKLKTEFLKLLHDEVSGYNGSLLVVSHDSISKDRFDRVFTVTDSGKVELLEVPS